MTAPTTQQLQELRAARLGLCPSCEVIALLEARGDKEGRYWHCHHCGDDFDGDSDPIWHEPETIEQQALELCYAIETLPASEQQTHLSILASALHERIKQRNLAPSLLDEIDRLRAALGDIVTFSSPGFAKDPVDAANQAHHLARRALQEGQQ